MISQRKGYFLTFELIYTFIPNTVKSVLTIKFPCSANVITRSKLRIYLGNSVQRLMNITDIVDKETESDRASHFLVIAGKFHYILVYKAIFIEFDFLF
jgi:hypothetical protein